MTTRLQKMKESLAEYSKLCTLLNVEQLKQLQRYEDVEDEFQKLFRSKQ